MDKETAKTQIRQAMRDEVMFPEKLWALSECRKDDKTIKSIRSYMSQLAERRDQYIQAVDAATTETEIRAVIASVFLPQVTW